MPRCDSSETYTRAVRPEPSPAVLPLTFAAGIFEVSRFSCMKFLGVPGVFDYAGLRRDSRYRPCSCCLPRIGARSPLFGVGLKNTPGGFFVIWVVPWDCHRSACSHSGPPVAPRAILENPPYYLLSYLPVGCPQGHSAQVLRSEWSRTSIWSGVTFAGLTQIPLEETGEARVLANLSSTPFIHPFSMSYELTI